MKRFTLPLLLCLASFASAQNLSALPVLYNPLVPLTRQRFTAQERQSLEALTVSLNSRRPPVIRKALGDDELEWCGPITKEDALLSFTAPFRNAQPEKLEVLLVCRGERNAISLTFTQHGKRTTYLLPPELGGGGMWGFVGAYTLRDLNGDGRRELALISASGSDVSSAYTLKLLSFDQRGPQLFLEDTSFEDASLPPEEDGGGMAQILRVQKGQIPIVYAEWYVRAASSKTWKKTGRVTRKALINNPINFVIWP